MDHQMAPVPDPVAGGASGEVGGIVMFWVEEPRANMKLRLGYMIQDRLNAEMRQGKLSDEKAWDIISDTTNTFFPQLYPPQVVDLGSGMKVLREPRERHV